MAMTAYITLANIIEKTVGHEPTQENMQYYYELRQEEKSRQSSHQREIDRKNIRRLVFGEDWDNPEAK